MCGCNSNVKFSKGEAQGVQQFVVPAPKRKLTTSCDTFGKCGRIERNDYTTSEGCVVSFGRNTGVVKTGFPNEYFGVSLSGSVSSIGLRQLAEEMAAMADELDGQKTVVALAAPKVSVKSKKKNAKKRK